jgi:hypothetical protein
MVWSAAYREPVCAKGPCDPASPQKGAGAPLLRLRYVMRDPADGADAAPRPKLVDAMFRELHACIDPQLKRGSPLVGASAEIEVWWLVAGGLALQRPNNTKPGPLDDCVMRAFGVANTDTWEMPQGGKIVKVGVAIDVLPHDVPKQLANIGFRCSRKAP